MAMTFNQWCGGKAISGPERLAFEAVWTAFTGAGIVPEQAALLLSDLHDSIDRETCDCEREDW